MSEQIVFETGTQTLGYRIEWWTETRQYMIRLLDNYFGVDEVFDCGINQVCRMAEQFGIPEKELPHNLDD